MVRLALLSLALFLCAVEPGQAQTRTICTLVVEVDSGAELTREGDCAGRMSPASTFKIAIALMGFDSGVLQSPEEPELPFQEGYIDWRPEWREPATPARWMQYSVVWYLQQITERLGPERFQSYVDAFGYGNRDLSGDPGKNNGLTHAWLSSSLQIAPDEQIAFLRKLVSGRLPVKASAVENTAAVMDHGLQQSGWRLYGKTGAGLPRGPDGNVVRGTPFGWFVGWASRDGRTVAFARLIQDSARQKTPPGFRARDTLIADLFSPGGLLD